MDWTEQSRHSKSTGSLVIDRIGPPFRATNPGAMSALIQYIDDLQEKYRRIIKEYKETKASHEEAFKNTVLTIANKYKQTARHNMEYIITTQPSKAKMIFTKKLHSILNCTTTCQ
jgi:hypothetical protein